MRSFKQVDDKHAFNLDNRQIAYLGTGLVTLFLLFFLLGVLYGTRLGGLQLTEARAAAPVPPASEPVVRTAPAEELPSEPVEVASAPVSTPNEPARTVAPAPRSERVFELGEETLSAEDSAALRKKLAAVQVPGEGNSPAPAPSAPRTEPTRQAAAAPAPSAPKAAPQPAPQKAPKPEPRRESASSVRNLPAGSGNYTVQVASLPDGKSAESFAAELARKGYPAYVMAAEVKGQTYYRVRFGRYESREEADRAAERYKRYERKDTLVTRIE